MPSIEGSELATAQKLYSYLLLDIAEVDHSFTKKFEMAGFKWLELEIKPVVSLHDDIKADR